MGAVNTKVSRMKWPCESLEAAMRVSCQVRKSEKRRFAVCIRANAVWLNGGCLSNVCDNYSKWCSWNQYLGVIIGRD
jgi:hypothetical protein